MCSQFPRRYRNQYEFTVEAETAKWQSINRRQSKMLLIPSMGSLMGARGNSGVILSQIFGGLARGLADAESITPSVLVGLANGCRDSV